MNDTNKGDFVKLLTFVMQFYGEEINEFSFCGFWEVLKEFDFIEVERAFKAHLGDPEQGIYKPKPANIIRLITGCIETRSLDAWAKLNKAIRRYGPYHSIVFDDPIIPYVIEDMGGWDRWGNINENDFLYKQGEFMKRYKGYFRQGIGCHHKILFGKEAISKLACGEPLPKPMFVGDRKKCEEIYNDHEKQLEYSENIYVESNLRKITQKLRGEDR